MREQINRTPVEVVSVVSAKVIAYFLLRLMNSGQQASPRFAVTPKCSALSDKIVIARVRSVPARREGKRIERRTAEIILSRSGAGYSSDKSAT